MSNLSDYYSYEYYQSSDYVYVYPFGTAWLASVPLILTVISIFTIIGNLFVIIAYFRDPVIREKVANLYILNLAISDLLVGSVIMTVNAAWTITDLWPLGEVFCKLYSSLDHTLSMVSIITMLLICWDRYCLVSMGMKYNGYQTHKQVAITLFLIWVVVLAIYTIMAFSWTAITGEKNVNDPADCEMEFLTSLAATVIVNFLEFIVPFTILVMINVAVFINIRRRSNAKVGQSTNHQVSSDVSKANPDSLNKNMEKTSQRTPTDNTQKGRQEGSESTMRIPNSQTLQNAESSGRVVPSGGAEDPSAADLGRANTREAGNGNIDRTRINAATGQGKTFARHRKAAFVLTVLVVCFSMCYLPYNISSVVYAICWSDCIPDFAWELISNLLWCNSTLNPIVYAVTNVHYRRNFRRFLCMDK